MATQCSKKKTPGQLAKALFDCMPKQHNISDLENLSDPDGDIAFTWHVNHFIVKQSNEGEIFVISRTPNGDITNDLCLLIANQLNLAFLIEPSQTSS